MDDFRNRRKRFFEGLDDFMGDDVFIFDEFFNTRIHDRLNRLMREAFQEFENREIEPGKSIVYGFSMRSGPDGKPVVEEFGNVPRPGEDQLPGEREPLVDVIDGKEEVTVIAELPGVDKNDIDLNADGRSLTISVDTADRRYGKTLRMPAEVDPDSIKANYKNGILEVKLKRAGKRPGQKKIRVD
jgi:HSP20 family protein